MGDAGDPAEGVVGVVARGIDLSDNRVLGPGDRRQRRHRGTHPVSAAMPHYRLQRARRIGKTQFGCLGE
jgi:hypothetical protein